VTTFRPDTGTDIAASVHLSTPRPGATIDVRRVDAAGGVIVTVAGTIDRNDAARLGHSLQDELDAEPTVLVINVGRVNSCAAEGVEVLSTVRERARAAGIGFHLLHLGSATARGWLGAAGLDEG
jgi:anti-anti-sigma regulatory factor